jgi:hypothetical protein
LFVPETELGGEFESVIKFMQIFGPHLTNENTRWYRATSLFRNTEVEITIGD